MISDTITLRSWTIPTRKPDEGLISEGGEGIILGYRYDAVFFGKAADTEWPRWEAGHLFTPDWHVRWRRMGARTRLVSCGTVPGLDALGAPHKVLGPVKIRQEIRRRFLWGERLPNEDFWLELRVPLIMREPDHHPSGPVPEFNEGPVRRYLETIVYRDARTGEFLFERFVRVGYETRESARGL